MYLLTNSISMCGDFTEHIKATQLNMMDVTPAEEVAPAQIYDLSAPCLSFTSIYWPDNDEHRSANVGLPVAADYQDELLADKQPPLTVENADRSKVMDAQEEYRSKIPSFVLVPMLIS